MNDELFTPEELAKKLKLSKYTIYEMIKRGDIETHRIGRRLRISHEQLIKYLNKKTNTENIFVAEIITENKNKYAICNGLKIAVSTEINGSAKICINPKDIILSKESFKSSARNVFKGMVKEIINEAAKVKILVDIGMLLTVLISEQSLIDLDLRIGDSLFVIFKTMSVEVL